MKRMIRVEVIEKGVAARAGADVIASTEAGGDGRGKTLTTEAGGRTTLEMEVGGSLKETLLGIGAGIAMPCGGNGRCGKCRVRFVSGAPSAGDADLALLGAAEIEDGVRLLCRCRPETDCVVEVIRNAEDDMVAEGAEAGESAAAGDEAEASCDADATKAFGDGASYAVAVDLGTTTIAAALVEVLGGARIVKTATCVNSQRRYGADVISRIAAATEDENARADMKRLVWEDIGRLVRELVSEETDSVGASTDGGQCEISQIVVAGNTTMLHLLTGKDVSGLGVYPYTPVSLEMEEAEWPADLGGDFAGGAAGEEKALFPKVTLLPGISAFVGADIVSGLYYVLEDPRLIRRLIDGCGEPVKALFIDLGTNGEMALVDGDTIKVTSTAAGPVFEAGGISCGVASVPGAIAHVDITEIRGADGRGAAFEAADDDMEKRWNVSYSTIGGRQPVGLCGTGVMELVSVLARYGIIDETGLLAEEFFDRGFPVTEDGSIRLTQKDIRNVQMGKAAIAAGIRTLTEECEPDVVFIAGGFGIHIDIEKIAHLKMMPAEFARKTLAVGNASLLGAVRYLGEAHKSNAASGEASARAILQSLVDRAEVIQLAETMDFDETYLESMNF